MVAPTAIKVLAYTDDALVFLSTVSEFRTLQHVLECYSIASNSLIDYHKLAAFLLSGALNDYPEMRQAVTEQRLNWPDSRSPNQITSHLVVTSLFPPPWTRRTSPHFAHWRTQFTHPLRVIVLLR